MSSQTRSRILYSPSSSSTLADADDGTLGMPAGQLTAGGTATQQVSVPEPAYGCVDWYLYPCPATTGGGAS